MSFVSIRSATLLGVQGAPVDIEIHLGMGLPGFTIVGQPDEACRESRDRVRAALLSCDLPWPNKRITVNLAPADLPKDSGRFDLAIALGILAASASYIAVPAAMRLALPQADPGIYLSMSLGVTFPFNIIFGISIFAALAQALG